MSKKVSFDGVKKDSPNRLNTKMDKKLEDFLNKNKKKH